MASITLADLQRQFMQSIAEAAKYFGVCESIMKRVCRRHGIRKWPQRTVRSLKRQIASFESNLETLDADARAPVVLQINSLKLRLAQLYKVAPSSQKKVESGRAFIRFHSNIKTPHQPRLQLPPLRIALFHASQQLSSPNLGQLKSC